MAGRSSAPFLTIRTEGGLLPSELLQRLVERDRDLDGLTEAAYHLIEGERLHEAITQSWSRLGRVWSGFQQAIGRVDDSDPATGLTRDRWLLPLFQELGYGRLVGSRPLEIEGQSYPVSHAWQQLPIHLVGWNIDLDRRTAGVAGAARVSPHGLVQALVNRSKTSSWGVVSNGRRLRLLRDNVSLTRQAYVEFDVEAMFRGQVYSDFVVLWLLLHQSRVEGERPGDWWIERWTQEAHREGARLLDRLRDGVQRAIETLGQGLLAHPRNEPLRLALQSGDLDRMAYYRQLLRLVYRLLFLFVAEDRGVLLDPAADTAAAERYTLYYSTARLRDLAGRVRGTAHGDLWQALSLVMAKLADDRGCPELGLPALDGGLWNRAGTSDLNGLQLSNQALLSAVRALAWTEADRLRRPVDYRNLGPEELGSVYESLLELHPEMNVAASSFTLTTAHGHERKTTGSYYTPPALVQALLDSALDPALDEAARSRDPEARILALKVCDPACGSGHFLLAAAHRIARRLAAVRTGDDEPSPEALRHALRDVIGRCIYGVDVNAMAVELCKVALWMEALEPGKPLSFLDHRIVCGNSLLGTTPALLTRGIPDNAFQTIEGDDRAIVSALRRRNRQERAGQMELPMVAEPGTPYGELDAGFRKLAAAGDESIADLHEKAEWHRNLVTSTPYRMAKLLADAWCAAFVWRKGKGAPEPITEDTFRRLESNPLRVPAETVHEVERLASAYGFLHWHVAFPDVFRLPRRDGAPDNEQTGWSGGFDVMLGNPPWDTLSPDAKEFFAIYDPSVRFRSPEEQEQLIGRLLSEAPIAAAWERHCRDLYAQVHFFKESGRYRLFAPGNLGKGDFNVYRMFVETALEVVRTGGWASQVAPENLYNGANAAAIRQVFFQKFRLSRLLGLENAREVWFKGIDSRTKFCLFAARRDGVTESFDARFLIRSEAELAAAIGGSTLRVPVALVTEFSPDALAVMEFRSQLDIDIATRMYSRWPKFGDASAGRPHRVYMREVDMGTDRDLFDEDPSGIPVYEGRMVWQYDHRAKGYRSGRSRAAVWPDLPFGQPGKSIQPQWYIARDKVPDKARERIARYRVGFCDVASPTNERTLVAALVPAGAICGHTVPTFVLESGFEWQYMTWLATANSFVMDFLVRPKVSLHMTFTILDSLPFPRPARAQSWVKALVTRALRLTATGPEMTGFWNALAKDGWVPSVPATTDAAGITDPHERLLTRAEIEAVVARDVFGLDRQEVEYILGTFPTAREYEEKEFGEFRSRRLILEAYDGAQA
jgi:hypothetical protein